MNDTTGRHGRRSAGLLVATLAVAGCSASIGGIDNAQLAVAEQQIDQELAADRIAVAEDMIAAYERRVPGPRAEMLTGRARWRAGDLLEGEASFRRASTGGLAGGALGLARAAASRGRWARARELAEEAVADPNVAPRAHMLLAGVALAEGDIDGVVADLRAAADSEHDAERAAAARAAAEALSVPSDRTDAQPLLWRGGVVSVALTRTASGVWLVPVRVNGHPARLRLALDAPRSGLESSFRQRIGATQGAPELLATLELAAEVTSQQLFQPLDTDAPGDGVLGFDALAMSRWILDLAAARLTVAPADLPVRGTIFDYPSLRETHWARVRLIRDGVGALLLLMPRLDGRVVSAALDVSGDTVVDARQRPFLDSEEPASRAIDTGESGGQPGRRADGDAVRVEIRFGGWREDWPVTLADLYPRARKGWVAPQMVLGGDLLAGWVLRWSPEARQLTLTPAVNGE